MKTDEPHFIVFIMGSSGHPLYFPYESLTAFQAELSLVQAKTLKENQMPWSGSGATWYHGVDIWGSEIQLNLEMVLYVQSFSTAAIASIKADREEQKARAMMAN